MGYYSEEIEKNTKYREDYKQSIDKYLEEQAKKGVKKRSVWFSPERYYNNPEKYRVEFKKLLGYPLTDGKKGKRITCKKEFVAEDLNVNIYRLTLKIGKIPFYGIYFEQKEKPETAPLVFGLHGGLGTPELISSIHENSGNYSHMVRRLTDRGINVFCPQLLLWGTDMYGNPYNRDNIDGRFRQLGGSITAFEIYLMQRALDYFIENCKIDSEKIGVCGLSYGGMYALDFSAVETRVKACFASSHFNDRFKYSWPDHSYKGAIKKIGDAEVAALVCPRALCVSVGDKDEVFDVESAKKEAEKVYPFYERFNKKDKFMFEVFDGVHETNKKDTPIDFFVKELFK